MVAEGTTPVTRRRNATWVKVRKRTIAYVQRTPWSLRMVHADRVPLASLSTTENAFVPTEPKHKRMAAVEPNLRVPLTPSTMETNVSAMSATHLIPVAPTACPKAIAALRTVMRKMAVAFVTRDTRSTRRAPGASLPAQGAVRRIVMQKMAVAFVMRATSPIPRAMPAFLRKKYVPTTATTFLKMDK